MAIKIFSLPGKIIWAGVAVAAVAAGLYMSVGVYRAGTSVQELLTENRQLREAIQNLTDTGKIGGARVVSTEEIDGQLYTTLKFWEYDRNNEHKIIQRDEYRVKGKVVHFDALIVRFSDPLIQEGQKSMYLWRRIYSEEIAPEQGFYINDPQSEPHRYKDFLAQLPADHRKMFWDSIWELAHQPDKLKEYGIEAVYGDVTYSPMEEGYLYIFQITPAGQIYPEVHRIL